MRKMVFVCATVFLGVLLAGNVFSATYDATGEWTITTSGNWVDPGNAGCEADEDTTLTATVSQSENAVTVSYLGITAIGTVDGNRYMLSYTYAEDGGTTTGTLDFTLSSSTSGAGVSNWYWTNILTGCAGGASFTVSRPGGGNGGGDGSSVTGYTIPADGSDVSDLRIGAVINTEDVGPVEAVFYEGGDNRTARGDRVIWGYFYADPSDVSWGSQDNPDLYVKIWFDAGGRIDVNFFHVSVPDIVVYSEYPNNGSFDNSGTTTMDNRYIRHEYSR